MTVENSMPNTDYTDALSKASGQQPPDISFGSIPIAITTYMGRTVLPGAHPGVLLPPALSRTKDKIISGELIDLATLLPKAIFSGSIEPETSRSLTIQLTTSSILAVHSQSTKKSLHLHYGWRHGMFI